MREWINANETIREDDHATVTAAIRLAVEEGLRKVVIPRYNARTKGTVWSFLHAIELPSDFTLILDNCYMEQAKGSYENLIINERAHDTAYSDVWENEARNITVIGEGNATLSGGEHNLCLEKTARQFENPSMFFQPLLFWHNVNGLHVENLHLEHFRWWSMLHIMCSNVTLRNLDFFAVPHVPNLDGIDLRIGCHDFCIENVTGRTGDDVLALTALAGGSERKYAVGGKDTNIRDIKVRNIKADSHTCYLVRLLNHDGAQEFNIEIDVIMDSSDPKSTIRNHAAFTNGSPFYSAKFMNQMGDIRDIRVRNVYSRGDAALALNYTLKDSSFENIHTFDDCPNLINAFAEGCEFDRVTVRNGFFEHRYPDGTDGEDLPEEKLVGAIVNVPILKGELSLSHIESGPVRREILVPDGEGTVILEDIRTERTAKPDELGKKIRVKVENCR